MIAHWIYRCRPRMRHFAARRVVRTAAIVSAGTTLPRPEKPIRQGGPVCQWERVTTTDSPLYGGALPPEFAGLSGYAAPGSWADGPIGGFGRSLTPQDLAALTHTASVIPGGDILVVTQIQHITPQQPVLVAEPPALAVLAVGALAMLLARRWRQRA